MLAPVIGAPPDISKELTTRLTLAARERGIPVVDGKSRKAEFTVRGYLVAATDPRGSKISYIWDITDAAGKRAERISGEELIAGKAGADPWNAVDPGVLDRISQKTASELVARLPKKGGAPETAAAGATPADRTATGSTGAAETSFVIPAVSGAPGDGKKSLTEAIRKRMTSSGIKLVGGGGRNAYTLKGSVSVSPADEGKQSVRIDWQVVDPSGKRLGTVSQQNTVPGGSLDGQWGPIADAAANAAADGILKLVPGKSG